MKRGGECQATFPPFPRHLKPAWRCHLPSMNRIEISMMLNRRRRPREYHHWRLRRRTFRRDRKYDRNIAADDGRTSPEQFRCPSSAMARNNHLGASRSGFKGRFEPVQVSLGLFVSFSRGHFSAILCNSLQWLWCRSRAVPEQFQSNVR